jgi:hypothetical protein
MKPLKIGKDIDVVMVACVTSQGVCNAASPSIPPPEETSLMMVEGNLALFGCRIPDEIETWKAIPGDFNARPISMMASARLARSGW